MVADERDRARDQPLVVGRERRETSRPSGAAPSASRRPRRPTPCPGRRRTRARRRRPCTAGSGRPRRSAPSTSAGLRRSAAWMTTPESPRPALTGRSSRHRASVASVVAWSSMSIRTNAPWSAARPRIRSTFARQAAGSTPRPIWLSLTLTLRSRPRAASASRTARYSSAAAAASVADATSSPRTSTVVRRPASRSLSSARQRLVERLAGDEPGDHRPGDRQPRREPAEGAPARQPQEERAQGPFRSRAEGGGGRHGAMVAAVPVD